MNEPTHILHWIPPYLNSDGNGVWELQGISDYEAGAIQRDREWALEDEPRDIDANDFTEWMASLVGFPVTVEYFQNRITCPVALRFRRREPAFLVFPAEVTS